MIKKYNIRVLVDTEQLTFATGRKDPFEALKSEVCWMSDAGIITESIKEVTNNKNIRKD